MSKKYLSLVTGGAGFIGSHLVDRLLKEDQEVIVIDNLSTGKKENLSPKANLFNRDIRDLKEIRPLFEKVDFVFHLAALPRVAISIERPIETNDINIKGTLNVLVAAKTAKVKKLVYASSTSVYGNQKIPLKETMAPQPLSPYGIQKYVGELYSQVFSQIFGLNTVSLRYFNVFGPRQDQNSPYSGVVAKFLKQKRRNEPLTIIGSGEQKRDFTYVFDVIEATILAAKKNVPSASVINIASGKNYSVNQLAEIIGGKIVRLQKRPGEIKNSLADISKAKKLLGWSPKYNLEKGLKEMKEKYGT